MQSATDVHEGHICKKKFQLVSNIGFVLYKTYWLIQNFWNRLVTIKFMFAKENFLMT